MQQIPNEQGLARVLGGRLAHDDAIGVRYGLADDGRVTLELPYAPVMAGAGARPIRLGTLVTPLHTASGLCATMRAGERRVGIRGVSTVRRGGGPLNNKNT